MTAPLRDHHLPPDCPAPDVVERQRGGVAWAAVDWRRAEGGLARVTAGLGRGAEALAEIPREALETAWLATVERFRDPATEERRRLEPALVATTGLSPAGVTAGLETVLGGVAGEPARELFRQAVARRRGDGETPPGPVAVLLASNLPALAVQPLLPALALGHPVLLKSPSAEPLFAPAFLDALVLREPRLAPALAAVTWRGGDAELEAPVLAGARRILVYGDAGTVADVERRAALLGPPGRVRTYGPRTSLAVVGRPVDPATVAPGLARDVALFDQRGCLSVEAVWTAGDAGALADRLAAALAERARAWPPGRSAPAALATVQQLRAEADLRELHRPAVGDGVAQGTVIVEPDPAFRPGPGLRTVRVHPLEDLERLPEILTPWRDRLQGAALAGEDARALAPSLGELGVSRTAEPGRLQSAHALWHNGGVHPLEALGG